MRCSIAARRPSCADVDRVTYNIGPARSRAKLTPRTKAVIPVHLFGLCADMDAIGKVCRSM